jgi:hypothetical protein
MSPQKIITTQTKLIIQNIATKATLTCGSEMWDLNRRENQHLKAATIKFPKGI